MHRADRHMLDRKIRLRVRRIDLLSPSVCALIAPALTVSTTAAANLPSEHCLHLTSPPLILNASKLSCRFHTYRCCSRTSSSSSLLVLPLTLMALRCTSTRCILPLPVLRRHPRGRSPTRPSHSHDPHTPPSPKSGNHPTSFPFNRKTGPTPHRCNLKRSIHRLLRAGKHSSPNPRLLNLASLL